MNTGRSGRLTDGKEVQLQGPRRRAKEAGQLKGHRSSVCLRGLWKGSLCVILGRFLFLILTGPLKAALLGVLKGE